MLNPPNTTLLTPHLHHQSITIYHESRSVTLHMLYHLLAAIQIACILPNDKLHYN